MMNTSLYRIMFVSISLCWLLSAKVHIDDQVDPSIAEKIAIEQALEQAKDTKETKEVKVDKDHSGDCEELNDKKVKISDAFRSLTPDEVHAKELFYKLNSKESQDVSNLKSLEIKEEFLNKGYTVEEYIQAVNADRELNSKENAVSYETYLEGINAKEQAIPLDYILESPSNTEGEIKNNNGRSSKIPEELLYRITKEKAEYWENLKLNPPHEAPYDGSRDCADADNGATDAYGDGCDGYTLYPSWCGGYDDDDFFSMSNSRAVLARGGVAEVGGKIHPLIGLHQVAWDTLAKVIGGPKEKL